MKVEILATDSLGVRSMATWVEAGGHKILIDPGAALGPKRYGLPPHRKEFERLKHLKELIRKKALESDVIVITHYHHDHYDPEDFEIYRGKVLFIKDPENNINFNQRKRARLLIKGIADKAGEINVAEGKEITLGTARIRFSEALPHGEGKRLGCVFQVLVEEDFRFLYTSDIQGAPLKEQLDFILSAKPDVIFMDGPPTYLGERSFSKEAVDSALNSMKAVVDELRPQFLILDHHITRSSSYRSDVKDLFLNECVVTAAEFMGEEERLLEAKRKLLWSHEGSV